ncbi:unnamed protein product [Protopolystoma xenopodis]|uniref:Uncharacterized protein n=1 Tax=Protopolystoma xenopodis TaxID=117903 RepID=A0A3S5CUA4_9PLAT|nr:unnamed protein product [Protopolystoma xenopodis]
MDAAASINEYLHPAYAPQVATYQLGMSREEEEENQSELAGLGESRLLRPVPLVVDWPISAGEASQCGGIAEKKKA